MAAQQCSSFLKHFPIQTSAKSNETSCRTSAALNSSLKAAKAALTFTYRAPNYGWNARDVMQQQQSELKLMTMRGHASSSSSAAAACRAIASVASGTVSRVGATETGSVAVADLVAVAESAAKRGAAVILEAVDKPRNITYKGATDLVTDTDRNTELAVLAEIRERFPDHLLLGEEGGVSGDASSEYLWCIDPLDGTTNFAHGYPCFATSVAVLSKGRPVAGCVVEFSGGPGHWITRVFTAGSGTGAFCDGKPIHVSLTDKVEKSLLVTGFGYEHDEAWSTNLELFKHFTDVSRGVRRLGAAAVDMCHVALGIVDGYWEYRLKPWDMAAGVLIVEEAGGIVTRMDGGEFNVFDRSVLVSNAALHSQIVAQTGPATERLISKNFDFSLWFKPADYVCPF